MSSDVLVKPLALAILGLSALVAGVFLLGLWSDDLEWYYFGKPQGCTIVTTVLVLVMLLACCVGIWTGAIY